MRADGKLTGESELAESAGVKVWSLLLARRKKESDLLEPALLRRLGLSRGAFLKFASRLVHGKIRVPRNDEKLRLLAPALPVPAPLLTDDSRWPDNGERFGLNDAEVRAMRWIHFLYQWYVDHTGPEAAHKFLGLDFEMLRRQTQILRALARTFGDDALIRVFVISDYEEG